MRKVILFTIPLVLFSCGDSQEQEQIVDGEWLEVGTEYDELKPESLNERVSYSIGFNSAGDLREYTDSPKYKEYFNKLAVKEGFYTGIDSDDSLAAEACNSKLSQYFGTPGVFDTLAISVDEASTCLGFMRGAEIRYSLKRRNVFNQLTQDLMKKGFKDGMFDYDTLIPVRDQVNMISEYFSDLIKKEGEDFLEANKKRPEVTTADNGLQFEVIKDGKGPKPTLNSTVSVYYTLSLVSGQIVESNADDAEPISFPLNGVIQGWQQGLQLMRKGGTYKLYVPYELGYGHQGTQGIQPYSTLIFEITLVDFK